MLRLWRCTRFMQATKVDQSIRLSELAFVFNYFYEMKSGAPYDYLIKIILVGDTGVGKTSFLLRFTEQLFDDASHIATIGKCDHFTTGRYWFQNKELDYGWQECEIADLGHCWLRKVSNDYSNVLQECTRYSISIWLYEVAILRECRHVDQANRAARQHRCWEDVDCDKVRPPR